MTLFSGKMSIFTAKISDDLVLVIDQVFRIFSFFYQIFRIFPMFNVIKKTPIFTRFILSRASENTTSQNIGGTDAWAVPHLKFLGDRPPNTPRSPPLVERQTFCIC